MQKFSKQWKLFFKNGFYALSLISGGKKSAILEQ